MDIRLTEEQKKQQGLIREVISDFEKSLRGSSNSVSLNNLAKELKDLGLIVDKNQDGNVDEREIRTLVKELKKISTSANVVKLFTKDGQINPSSKVLTDITGDNIVNSQDIQALQNLLKGKEDAAGKPPVLSTQAVGEKDAIGRPPVVSTQAVGEKDAIGRPPVLSTQAVGEEDAAGKPPVLSTQAVGEKDAIGRPPVVSTQAVGEEDAAGRPPLLSTQAVGEEDAAGKPPVVSTQAVGIDAHQSMIEHYNSQLTLERNKPEPDIGKINSLTVSIITHQSAITTLQDS
jgi:hypothetical protein